MPITMFGTQEVSRDFTAFADSFTDKIRQAIVRWVMDSVLPAAKLKAPVLTGNLRESLALISVTQSGNTVTFLVGWGTRAIYGKYQERGTKFVTAKRFMTRALTETATQLPGAWIQAIRISEVGKYLKSGVRGFGPLVL